MPRCKFRATSRFPFYEHCMIKHYCLECEDMVIDLDLHLRYNHLNKDPPSQV